MHWVADHVERRNDIDNHKHADAQHQAFRSELRVTQGTERSLVADRGGVATRNSSSVCPTADHP